MIGKVELFIALLAILSFLAILARKLLVPLPIMLIAAGLLLSLLPGLPALELDPELVLILFLPPLVYIAGVNVSWPEFLHNLRPITLLAVGCVIFTAFSIALIAATVIPGLPLVAALVLGAAIAPPDVVAATSMAGRLGIPKRTVAILEGEGVVNDATSLTLYKFAVAALVAGSFSAGTATLSFLAVIIGEIIWGLLLGKFFSWLWPRVHDSSVEIALSFILPYAAFLLPNQLGGSGVLATVVAGLFAGHSGISRLTSRTRIQGYSVWNTIRFVLENILFLITGLQLRSILNHIERYSQAELAFYGLLISVSVIVLRFIWVFPATYLPRLLSRSLRSRDPYPNWRYPFLVSFAGMRGGVSLAAALAIPIEGRLGEPFPQRDVLIFLTFCVIIVTLVLQGLTLPYVIRALGIDREGHNEKKELQTEEFKARLAVAEDAIDHLEKQVGENPPEHHRIVREEYLRRSHNVQQLIDGEPFEQVGLELRLRQQLVDVERASLAKMHFEDRISNEVFRLLMREIDYEEARLVEKFQREN